MTKKKKQPLLRRPVFFGLTFAFAILSSYLIVNWPMLGQQASYALGRLPEKNSPQATDYISIPKINLEAPIVWVEENDEDTLQQELLKGIVHHPETSLPGERGNSVYIGHSSNYWWEESDYNTIFGLLEKLEEGDQIIIVSKKNEYLYEVTERKVVSKNSPEIFTVSENEEITLITCWPLGTNWQNYLVRATLVNQ